MYARYAERGKIDLHFCCFDMGLKRIRIPGITVNYIPLSSNRFNSYLNFFIASKIYVLKENFDLIFHIDGKFTLAFRLLNLFRPMVLDIRSGDLSDNRNKLWLMNKQILISSWFYKHVSVISDSLCKELGLNSKKTVIIPLGGELHSFAPKQFNTVKILYFGSLNNRNIDHTITGLSLFKMQHPELDIEYDIVGFGNMTNEKTIRDTIENTGMHEFVTFHGRKTHSELIPFLDKCNVGIVYIPQRRYYDFQPSTKLYEYLLAGLPVIATNTLENRISLKTDCGILCEDNPESFSEALKKFIQERDKFNSESIKRAYLDYRWEHIVRNIWQPFVLNAIKYYK